MMRGRFILVRNLRPVTRCDTWKLMRRNLYPDDAILDCDCLAFEKIDAAAPATVKVFRLAAVAIDDVPSTTASYVPPATTGNVT